MYNLAAVSMRKKGVPWEIISSIQSLSRWDTGDLLWVLSHKPKFCITIVNRCDIIVAAEITA